MLPCVYVKMWWRSAGWPRTKRPLVLVTVHCLPQLCQRQDYKMKRSWETSFKCGHFYIFISVNSFHGVKKRSLFAYSKDIRNVTYRPMSTATIQDILWKLGICLFKQNVTFFETCFNPFSLLILRCNSLFLPHSTLFWWLNNAVCKEEGLTSHYTNLLHPELTQCNSVHLHYIQTSLLYL